MPRMPTAARSLRVRAGYDEQRPLVPHRCHPEELVDGRLVYELPPISP